MKGKKIITNNAIDICCVKIAMMIAGLDGRLSSEEYVLFEDMLKYYGCSGDALVKSFDEGLEAAGYIVLQSQRLPAKELMEVFLHRAETMLSGNFDVDYIKRLRAAFMTWTIMAMSDGKYLDVERRGICTLKDAFNKKMLGNKQFAITDEFLSKCECLAEGLVSAQKFYEQHPVLSNKNKCESAVRRIRRFLEVE